MDQRKAREREWATFDENRRTVEMLNRMRDNIEGTYHGGEVTWLVQKIADGKISYELSWKVKVMKSSEMKENDGLSSRKN